RKAAASACAASRGPSPRLALSGLCGHCEHLFGPLGAHRDHGLVELAAVEEDAVALAAVIHVHRTQYDLFERTRTGRAVLLGLRRNRRRARLADQRRAQIAELGIGHGGELRDLAFVEPQTAALGAQIHLDVGNHRLVEDRSALDANDVFRRHALIVPRYTSARMDDYSLLEQRLDYRFKNADLLRTALTHKSFVNQHPALLPQ